MNRFWITQRRIMQAHDRMLMMYFFFTLLLHLSFRVCSCISCRTQRVVRGSKAGLGKARAKRTGKGFPLMSVWLIEKHPYKAMHNSTGFDGFHCFRCFAPPPKEPSTVMGGVTVHSFGWFKINSKDRPTHPSSLKQAETKMQPKEIVRNGTKINSPLPLSAWQLPRFSYFGLQERCNDAVEHFQWGRMKN